MRGRLIRLSANRRFVANAMRVSVRIPTIAAQRQMNLASVATARSQCPNRPSWAAIFTKAFALVADDFPELRRAFMRYPWAHFYEYPENAAIVMIERMQQGEHAIFPLRIRNPGWFPIIQLSDTLRAAKTAPIETMTDFMRILWVSGLPWPIRNILWWTALNVGRQRGNYFGTFVVSSITSMGAELLYALAPGMVLLSYGNIAPDGTVNVRAMWDHRVVDGALFARAFVRMEEVLRTTILEELKSTEMQIANQF